MGGISRREKSNSAAKNFEAEVKKRLKVFLKATITGLTAMKPTG